MDMILLIKIIAVLTGVLAVLLFFYIYSTYKNPSKKKKSVTKPLHVREAKPDFAALLEVIRDKNATTQELKEAVDLVLKYYGKIPKKLGMRANPKFEIYSEIILRLCHHPNTNKEIILRMDRELTKLNPEYKLEISDSLEKGLNTRGI